MVLTLALYAYPSGIFGPMLPFAAANRVRLILVNRRDYPGSTPLSDAELAELGSPDLETRARALAQQGLDIGLFLAWLVREENIPPVSTDRDGNKQGGIALVAWSLAHTPLAGFLAHADALPTDALRTLDPCLRSYCIFGEHQSFQSRPIAPRKHSLTPSSQSFYRQMRRTAHSDFRRSASTTHWSNRRIRWRSASRASIPGYRRTTHIQISLAGPATQPSSILPPCRIPHPCVLVPQRSTRSPPQRSRPSRGPAPYKAPRHCSTACRSASRSSRRDACC